MVADVAGKKGQRAVNVTGAGGLTSLGCLFHLNGDHVPSGPSNTRRKSLSKPLSVNLYRSFWLALALRRSLFSYAANKKQTLLTRASSGILSKPKQRQQRNLQRRTRHLLSPSFSRTQDGLYIFHNPPGEVERYLWGPQVALLLWGPQVALLS